MTETISSLQITLNQHHSRSPHETFISFCLGRKFHSDGQQHLRHTTHIYSPNKSCQRAHRDLGSELVSGALMISRIILSEACLEEHLKPCDIWPHPISLRIAFSQQFLPSLDCFFFLEYLMYFPHVKHCHEAFSLFPMFSPYMNSFVLNSYATSGAATNINH